jgi:hypothetical protein
MAEEHAGPVGQRAMHVLVERCNRAWAPPDRAVAEVDAARVTGQVHRGHRGPPVRTRPGPITARSVNPGRSSGHAEPSRLSTDISAPV